MIDLKTARESCDRSVDDVARVLKVSEATVKRWERSGDPKVLLSQFPLFLALYGLEPEMELAKERLRDMAPTVDDLIREAEQKEAWSPMWRRMSVVVPESAMPLIEAATKVMQSIVHHIDDRRPIILGQLLINGNAELLATYGFNDAEDKAC